jgi:DNA-directed RNA polymerase subunit M/transcription elongation factor TFIIS
VEEKTMARSSSQPMTVPLGSLTQAGARVEAACSECGSERVTHLAMTLTDGTPVEFVSCHRCEHKTWVDASGVQHQELPVTSVLDKTRKPS